MNKKYYLALALVGAMSTPIDKLSAAEIQSSVNTPQVSKSKQTPFGLYLTPVDAATALEKDPSIVLIDVRDPFEITFIGHPAPMDVNIPLRTISHNFNADGGNYHMTPNTKFVDEVAAAMKVLGFSKSHPIIVSCRSGSRSAVAARALFAAGYKNVWNQVEGFEGSIDAKTGDRTLDGWRNSGLPWRYKIAAGKQWKPTAVE